MACDGCDRRREAIRDAWDFGDFFWDVVANMLAALLVGLPLVAAAFRYAHRAGA